ncbi:hypothetical protein K439DRAFT_638700 [Ramaria rubella]|nr:hypothetical protein K439DRAFT_638700 [Ramaria rubella]
MGYTGENGYYGKDVVWVKNKCERKCLKQIQTILKAVCWISMECGHRCLRGVNLRICTGGMWMAVGSDDGVLAVNAMEKNPSPSQQGRIEDLEESGCLRCELFRVLKSAGISQVCSFGIGEGGSRPSLSLKRPIILCKFVSKNKISFSSRSQKNSRFERNNVSCEKPIGKIFRK